MDEHDEFHHEGALRRAHGPNPDFVPLGRRLSSLLQLLSNSEHHEVDRKADSLSPSEAVCGYIGRGGEACGVSDHGHGDA